MASLMQASGQKLSVIDIAQTVKAIVPRSFEKTFDGMQEIHIATAFKVCVDGLTYEQIKTGINTVRDNGFCPDPAMFRKWCLGITGFGTEQQRVQDSFKGKHAALANIIRWVDQSKTQITNAEKEAYDRCYEMFGAIQWASNVDRASWLAYEAFKENYADVVREFAESGIVQVIWNQPVVIETDVKTRFTVKPMDFGMPEISLEQRDWVGQRTKELVEQGFSVFKAALQANKEYLAGTA